ncbi:MAG: beta-1,6-N-acetylglucosaminyltransferase [Adhaeribacter sp.]
MRIAHLIIAHKEPAQVARLVKHLVHERSDIYLHVDKKTDISAFAFLEQAGKVIFIRNRQLVRWAGYSFTKAILTGMREILASGRPYDFINVMSGQEYPIKPLASLHDYLEQHLGYTFMCCEPNGSPWWQEAISRVEQYHSTDFHFRGQYQLQFLANRLLPKRKFPLPFTLYGGNCAMYWTISQACAAYVVDFLDQHPQVPRFARFTWAPDEFLIPTIIMNSPFRNKVIPNNLRYIDWSEGGPNPKLLTKADFERLKNSDSFFARKFDVRQDSQILDKLDEMLEAALVQEVI